MLGGNTLSASLLNASELPDTLAKKLPRYPQLPVTLLGRLAVDQSIKGRGIGQFPPKDALRRSLEAVANIAAMGLCPCWMPKVIAAQPFYRHFSFRSLHERLRRPFLPVKAVDGVFDD